MGGLGVSGWGSGVCLGLVGGAPFRCAGAVEPPPYRASGVRLVRLELDERGLVRCCVHPFPGVLSLGWKLTLRRGR